MFFSFPLPLPLFFSSIFLQISYLAHWNSCLSYITWDYLVLFIYTKGPSISLCYKIKMLCCKWSFWYHTCKGTIWILSPKGKRIKGQRAQYNEFVESGLETRFWWTGQCSQWTKDGKKARKDKEKQGFVKKIFLGKIWGE